MALPQEAPDIIRSALDTLREFGSPPPETPQVGRYPAGFNPYAAPPQYRGGTPLPSPIASNTDAPTPGYTSEEQQQIYNTPVFGGLARVLNSPLARSLAPSPEEQTNPIFALGPAGELIGPLEPALAGLGQIASDMKAGALQALHGTPPAFATEQAGMARIDLGVGGGFETPRLGANLAETQKNLAHVGVPPSAEQAAAEQGLVTAAQQAHNEALAAEISARQLGVNIAKIEAPQETKDYILQVARTNQGFEAQRRGVVSVDETLADAAQIAKDALKFYDLKPGTALNAEQLSAVKGAMIAKGNEVVALQDQVAKATLAGVRSDELNLRLIAAAQEHSTLQRVFSGARAESGRALRIQREITGALQAGTGTAYDKAVEAIGGRENVRNLIDRLQKIWTDPALSPDQREVSTYKFIQNLDRPKFFDRLNEFWVNSILSSPVTHMVNVSGQTALQVADMTAKFGAAGIEAASTVGGLRRPRERFFSEALVAPYGAVSGLGDGFRRAVTMLRTGVSPSAMTKFRETGDIARAEANAAILNIPTRLLGAEDQVFYALGYSKGIWESAARTAAKERRGILSGDFGRRVAELVANPTEDMAAYADTLGRRAGLRSDAGDVTSAILSLREKGVEVGPLGTFRPLRYVIPFVKTPMELVKIGAEYSPAGLVKVITATGPERSDIIARSALGSAGMAYLAKSYADGLVTGAAPSDPAERDAFYREGKVPYAVRLGNEWVSFGRLEPIATPLKWTALLMDAARNNGGQPADVVAGKMAGALTKALTDATYLSGFSALIDALNDPERSAPKFLAQLANGFIPATVRTITQANDPFIRSPKGIIEQIESTLPFLNENIAPKQNVYGEDVRRSEGKQGIAGVLSPVDFNSAVTDPIDGKLKSYSLPDLVDANGLPIKVRDLQVGFVSKDIANYRLTPDEGNRYQRYAGTATYKFLSDLFDNKRLYDGQKFSALNPTDQVRAIKSAISDARETGRAQVADEIVAAASDQSGISRGADMRLSTIGPMRDRATYIEGLNAQGKLPQAVRSYLDQHKSATEPTVSEYLAAAPYVREYLSLAPYTIGNPEEWTALADAKKQMSKYLKASPAPPGWTDLDWFQRGNPDLGVLVRRYSYEAVRNPRRKALLTQHPEVDRFVNSTDLPLTRFVQPPRPKT